MLLETWTQENCFSWKSMFLDRWVGITFFKRQLPVFASFSHGQTENNKMYRMKMALISFSEQMWSLCGLFFQAKIP